MIGASSREAQTAAIRAASPLLELAREACPALRRMGAEWRGPCPIHGGEGDNFSVNPARGLWHCHTCNAGGDVFDLARQWRGLADFVAARAWLAARAGIPLDEAPLNAHPHAYDIDRERARHGAEVAGALLAAGDRAPARADGAPDPQAPETSVAWSARSADDRARAAVEWRRRTLDEGGTWHEPADVYTALRDALPLSDAARTYLAGRGLDPDAAYALGVRSVDDWTALPGLLDAAGIDAWEAVAAGLHVATAYALPDGRVESLRGGSPAFVGPNLPALVFFYVARGGRAAGARVRALASADDLLAAGLGDLPRYLSLRGNQPRVPWGADALADVRGAVLHVAEGEPDALSLRQVGVRSLGIPGASSVPGLGAADGDAARVPWLRAAGAARRVVLWFDPDEGGDRGAPKLRDALQAANGWTAAETARRVVRARLRAADDCDKVDVNAALQAGQLAALVRRVETHPG